MNAYEVLTPREIRPLVDQIKGQRSGYAAVVAQLRRDPCAQHLGAYRLSGPLEPKVCGLHLRRGWRLAFSIQPPACAGEPDRVVILYVGRREPRRRRSDAWTVLHDLFGVENPPESHHKTPCCDSGLPELADEERDAFLREVRRLTRGR